MEREKAIENFLGTLVHKAGGLYWKFTSPGNAGVPDRIILLNGRAIFVELKRPGGTLRAQQKARIKQIQEHGLPAYVVTTKEEAKLLMKYIEKGLMPDARHFHT